MARRRRTARWFGLVIPLLIAVWALYRFFSRQIDELAPLEVQQQLWLPALSLAIVVLALGLAGVLIRNLVTLIVEQRRGILGARLRTKLVFFFLALVLVPSVVLFSGSVQVIKQTVEAILREPLQDLTRVSREIVDSWNSYFQDQAGRWAEVAADELASWDAEALSDRRAVDAWAQEWRRRESIDYLRVVVTGRTAVSSTDLAGRLGDDHVRGLTELSDVLTGEVGNSGRVAKQLDYLGEGLIAHAVAPVGDPEDPTGYVTVALMVPNQLAQRFQTIDAADRAYRQFRVQRRGLVRFYVSLIGLVFLVILFVSVWIGFYVARRISEPIREVSAAAREISAGNLDVRVHAKAGDEMATLVDAFNEMAGELQENREVITRSTADLRRSNRALDERRRYIETLLASLSTAVISLDASGQVTTANPAVKTILGVDLRGRDHAASIFRDHGLAPLGDLLLRDEGAEPAETRRDLELPHGAGSIQVSVQISPLLGAGGERLGTLVMVEDLTELLRAQKAAAWREIARRIAHEIKNPLTPIQLAAQRLRKKFREGAEDLGGVLPEATASIEREVGALKQLVDEFSKFARMPELRRTEVSFRQVVADVLALYKGMPAVRWEVDLGEDGLEGILLDAQQMRRVLINLVDNAISAMDGAGLIRIAARRSAEDGVLRFQVADDGPGIPPADRDKMFSPYFSTKKRGTGLGLAIVHRIVTDHQGTIRVEDNEPAGARFVVEIPVASVPSTSRGA